MSPKLLNILLILIPVVLYYAYLDPMYSGSPGLIWTPEKSISILQATNVQYENTAKQVDLIKESVSRINKDYTAIPQDVIDRASILLPDSIDKINLRKEVVAIADKAGVALNGVTVTDDPKNQSTVVGAYLVNFTVKVRYPIFKALMESYERSTRVFMIETVSIKKLEAKELEKEASLIDNQDKLNCIVSFRVTYLKK